MIGKLMIHYAVRLDEYLGRIFPRPEGMAEVGSIGGADKERPGKLVVSLLSLERETAGGIGGAVHKDGREYVRMMPPLHLNLNLILAAVYDPKHYAESLSVLSHTLRFVQSTPSFVCEGRTYTVEIVNLSFQEINNIWTTAGGQYHPSVICKVRGLTIDDAMPVQGGTTIRRTDV